MDDDPAIAALIRAVLTASGLGPPLEAGDGAAGLALEADLFLLDLHLPDIPGFDVLAALRARPQPPAVVVVTAHGSEAAAVRALRAGADDYLVKDAALPQLLPEVVERQRRIIALRGALAAAEQDLLRSERLAAVGEMTVTLHHTINNPLMAANAEVELLLADRTLTPAQRESLTGVRESLRRIGEVIHRVQELRAAPSTEYLEGSVRMVDLAGGDTEEGVGRGRATVVIPDAALARIVGHLLRGAGFTVEAGGAELLRSAAGAVTVVQAGAAAPPHVAGRSGLVVVVGPPPALVRYQQVATLLLATPFDPGAAIEEILRRLDDPGR